MESSPELGQLFAALARARKEFKPVVRNAQNPYYQSVYAELDSYIDATKDGLSNAEICVLQIPVYNPEESGVIITTILGHSSGQWMSDRLWMPVSKQDSQGVGSAITYGRRYSYAGFTNTAAQGDDDDANAAVGMSQKDRGASTTDKDEKRGKNINAAQIRALWSAMSKSEKSKTQLREFLATKYGVEHTADIPKKKFDAIMRWILGTPEPEEPPPPPEREPGSDDDLESPPLDFKK